MKHVKHYLRNSLLDANLNSIISIEKRKSKSLEIDEVINKFLHEIVELFYSSLLIVMN